MGEGRTAVICQRAKLGISGWDGIATGLDQGFKGLQVVTAIGNLPGAIPEPLCLS